MLWHFKKFCCVFLKYYFFQTTKPQPSYVRVAFSSRLCQHMAGQPTGSICGLLQLSTQAGLCRAVVQGSLCNLFKSNTVPKALPRLSVIPIRLMSLMGEHLACSLWGWPEGELTQAPWSVVFSFVHVCTFCCL